MQELWQKIVDLLERASNQRHILALRDGMIGSVPIILVGSTFLLLGSQAPMGEEIAKYLPALANSDFGLWVADWYPKAVPTLLLPFRFTMKLLSLYVAFTIAAALAKQYDMPQVPSGLTAMASLLMTGGIVEAEVKGKEQWVLAVEPLGAEGLFLAIILGMLTVELSRWLTFLPQDEHGNLKTGGVPEAVVHAFASFLPMLACLTIIWLIRHVFDIDVHEHISESSKYLSNLGDSYFAVLVVNIFLHLFGVAGVHGISVINAAMLPIWLQFLVANSDAQTAGQAMPYLTAYPFYQWFIWIGGAGATLGANIRCLFSKNAHIKRIGKVSIVPGIFNINEPLLFGLPVVANPILAIPFIASPLVCGTIAYFATAWGFVGKAFIEAPWVMPCFLGAFLSTQDFRAVILVAVNLTVSYVIWSPFISGYERRLAKDGAPGETLSPAPTEEPSVLVGEKDLESETEPNSGEPRTR